MVYIIKIFSYAFTFMLGYYIGNGGCMDRMLDTNETIPSDLENRIHQNYEKNNIKEAIYYANKNP